MILTEWDFERMGILSNGNLTECEVNQLRIPQNYISWRVISLFPKTPLMNYFHRVLLLCFAVVSI